MEFKLFTLGLGLGVIGSGFTDEASKFGVYILVLGFRMRRAWLVHALLQLDQKNAKMQWP